MINACTATRHALERRAGSLRHSSHVWEIVSVHGVILGAYNRANYAVAVSDAATLRQLGVACDVRKSLTRGAR